MKFISLIFAALLLTGCSGLFTSNDEVRYFYVLNPLEDIEAVKKPYSVHLNVQIPEVPDWLDSENIMLLRTKNQVDYYAGSRWVTRPSAMLGQIITESLISNHVASDIFYAGAEKNADLLLLTEVIAFDADYSEMEEAPIVRVEMQLRLVTPQGLSHYQFRVKSHTQARQNTVPAIIDAFDDSLENCLVDLVRQTAKGLKIPPKRPLMPVSPVVAPNKTEVIIAQ